MSLLLIVFFVICKLAFAIVVYNLVKNICFDCLPFGESKKILASIILTLGIIGFIL